MLSKREPDQRLQAGSWNLVCRQGWFGLHVLAFNMNLANVKKKKKLRYFTFKKKNPGFWLFLKKKKNPKVWQAASTLSPLPISQGWAESASTVPWGLLNPWPRVRHLSPSLHLSPLPFRFVHTEGLLTFYFQEQKQHCHNPTAGKTCLTEAFQFSDYLETRC